MLNIGYCCINTTLSQQNIKTSRSMIRRTFDQRGLDYVSELSLQNVRDLQKIIKWNIENDISLFRISSNLFPWSSEYELSELSDFDSIVNILSDIGTLIKLSGIRVSFHPDHFVKLASEKSHVVTNGINDINHHAEIFDIMGLDKSYKYPINIHIGSAGNSKSNSIDRFLNSLDRISDSARSRLVIENDDKLGLYSVSELIDNFDGIIPITFDYFHHSLNDGGLSECDAFNMCYETWPNDVTPLFHFSSSKRDHEDSSARITAHSDYIYNKIDNYNKVVDVDLEAKAKELAVFKYVYTHG
jgi:UV DNA damage endonuclease